MDKYRNACFVVKLGGGPLSDPDVLDSLILDLSILRQEGIRVVIVHGGGSQLSELSKRLGIRTTQVNGRRVTDRETLKLAKMVFAGEISTDIVAALRRHGVPGVGLSGVDGDLIDAERRPPVELVDKETGEVRSVDFENVGDVREVNPSILNLLLDRGFVPVVASLASDDQGSVLNINADTIASEIATALGAEKLILMSDVPGLLRDVKDRDSRISEMTLEEVRELVDSASVAKGMVPKLTSVIRTLEGGTHHIHVVDGNTPHALLDEINSPGRYGTFIAARAQMTVGQG